MNLYLEQVWIDAFSVIINFASELSPSVFTGRQSILKEACAKTIHTDEIVASTPFLREVLNKSTFLKLETTKSQVLSKVFPGKK